MYPQVVEDACPHCAGWGYHGDGGGGRGPNCDVCRGTGKRSERSKATNPKDAMGMTKLPIDLVPDTAVMYMALAFLEGALKYGKYNWRIAGVRWSIYEAAFERHRMKLRSGEWADPKTNVPHMASMMACLAIILDAKACGKLVDDRPPRAPALSQMIDDMTSNVAHLKEVFKEHNPHQYTIEDSDAVGN
jgi:Domain of unknown function (DUF5664)